MKLKVRAHLNSSQTRLEEYNGIIHVYLTKPPKDGKANTQLLKLLKKKYGPCSIISGKHSRDKIVEIIFPQKI